LFNVHGAISDAGGSIRAKATPSHGISYEILLRRSDDPEAAPPTDSLLEPQMEKATILLLHSDHAVRSLVLEGLDQAGYEAIGARDSGEALEWMDLYPGSIALLVTDVELCDTSGPALAAQMAVRNPGIRVVFTADHAVDPSVKKAWTERGARFLEKPFRLEELIGIVNAVLAEDYARVPQQAGVAAPAAPVSLVGTPETIFGQDTAEFHADTSLTPLELEQAIQVAHAMGEVSGRKVAEDQFRHSDEIFHLMVNNIKDHGIIMLDPRGEVVTWNTGSQAISGYRADEVVGKHFSLFYSSSDIEHGKPEQELATANSTGRFAAEGWRLRKDATAFWADVVVTALRDPSGRLLGFVQVTRDMSERKQAEALDAAKTAELVEANKELEAFAYSVSHDLRAPLRHLDGFADLLRKNWYHQMDALGQRYLDKITASAQRMGRLVDDLLAFSRLLRADVSRTHVNLRLLQAEVRRGLEPDLAGRTVEWIIGDLPDVYGDRSMLRQVFFNLLSNAVKFTRDKQEARIEIGCAGITDGEATIFVRDNGAGFEMQYVAKLFEVFQRLHSDEFEGTGVGLANVRRIVERHGGRVWAEGAVDQGATFYFTLRLNRGTDHA
jgi:PAS domain S-box-containing protein